MYVSTTSFPFSDLPLASPLPVLGGVGPREKNESTRKEREARFGSCILLRAMEIDIIE
jgi:hypothetical protein